MSLIPDAFIPKRMPILRPGTTCANFVSSAVVTQDALMAAYPTINSSMYRHEAKHSHPGQTHAEIPDTDVLLRRTNCRCVIHRGCARG